ncbi:MAG: hypothetical protein IT385_01170 [Deltaproteobacteria bacterium]|nr:hypothetical protein [Deltaproteobacteria bacterium]
MERADGFVQQILTLGALDQADARRAALAALRALALRLPPAEAADLEALRAEVAARDEADARSGPAAAVAAALGVAPERADAIANVVLVAALESLGDRAPSLIAALPPDLRPTPTSTAGDMPVSRAPRPPAEDHSLAGGRPGHGHPLADAAPERAHTHSIARADDPHADTRLSSAHGVGAAPGRSLADGRPGSERPLSTSKD